ncbi:MAG TPA: MarR family transcriptional regulator [Acidimicrobiales bacterium]|nr:MarR family transcriptional regulator [Acidimicrobiales bacterium]
MGDPRSADADNEDSNRLADAVLQGAQVLLEVSAGAMREAGDLSPSQYQVLLILSARGAHRLADLATTLGVSPSNATRMADRLVHKRLIRRHRQSGDRREVKIALTPAGQAMVEAVTAARRAMITRMLSDLTPAQKGALELGLRSLSGARAAADTA